MNVPRDDSGDAIAPPLGRLSLGERGSVVRLSVHVKPRSSRTMVLGERAGALEVALRAAPVEGAANQELVELMAGLLGVRRSSVTVALGASGRSKVIEIVGLSADEVRARLTRSLA
jgi:uncharacterized protein (TIGR00251 family)